MYKLQFNGLFEKSTKVCGSGYVIYKDREVIYYDYKLLSFNNNTNNYAKYSALLFGIEKVIELNIKNISIESDDMTIIKELNKIYEIKCQNLVPIYNKIIEELIFFDNFIFKLIKQENNKLSYKIANQAINKYYNI